MDEGYNAIMQHCVGSEKEARQLNEDYKAALEELTTLEQERGEGE